MHDAQCTRCSSVPSEPARLKPHPPWSLEPGAWSPSDLSRPVVHRRRTQRFDCGVLPGEGGISPDRARTARAGGRRRGDERDPPGLPCPDARTHLRAAAAGCGRRPGAGAQRRRGDRAGADQLLARDDGRALLLARDPIAHARGIWRGSPRATRRSFRPSIAPSPRARRCSRTSRVRSRRPSIARAPPSSGIC